MVCLMNRLTVLLAALSWLPSLRAADPPARVDDLRKERLAVVHEIAKQATAAYKVGTGSYEEMRDATRMVLEAELDQCTTDKERLAVLEQVVAEARKWEDLVAQTIKAGQVPARTGLKARADRLAAEI